MAAARVLVVDDDVLMLEVLSRALRSHGYEVLPAQRARQALEILRNSGPVDVVVSDIRMPEMEGTQLVREVGDLSPRTASMLTTAGSIDSAEIPEGVPVPKKPFSIPDLISTLQATLARSAQG